MEVNDKLRMLRKVHKMTQSEVAEQLNMSTNGYAKIENGETRMNMDKLKQIAQVFEMDILELMAIGERNTVYLINENGDNNNKIGQSTTQEDELNNKIEKLQIALSYKDELLQQKEQELQTLRNVLNLLKLESK